MFKLKSMKTLRIVNNAMLGEPENPCLQNVETNEIYEFSQIVGETIENKDLSHPTIQRILNNGHLVQATIEGGNVTLHF